MDDGEKEGCAKKCGLGSTGVFGPYFRTEGIFSIEHEEMEDEGKRKKED